MCVQEAIVSCQHINLKNIIIGIYKFKLHTVNVINVSWDNVDSQWWNCWSWRLVYIALLILFARGMHASKSDPENIRMRIHFALRFRKMIIERKDRNSTGREGNTSMDFPLANNWNSGYNFFTNSTIIDRFARVDLEISNFEYINSFFSYVWHANWRNKAYNILVSFRNSIFLYPFSPLYFSLSEWNFVQFYFEPCDQRSMF